MYVDNGIWEFELVTRRLSVPHLLILSYLIDKGVNDGWAEVVEIILVCAHVDH